MRLNPFDKSEHPNVYEGCQYALDVISGKQIACSFIKGAASRFMRDIQPHASPNFYFDAAAAEKYLKLTQKFQHAIGQWKTVNIIYEPWQKFIWANIMGFINTRTGFRRFRTAHVEIARGNGKSAMASQAVLYFLALDNSKGNQVSTVATKKDQARIVLDSARAMARKNESFRKARKVKVLAHTIAQENTNSIARALSSEHSGLDGLNDVLAVCDELHAMRRATFEVISSGMSKRADSLILCITTAGSDVESVGYSQSVYAKKIASGELNDDTFFSAVFTLDEGDEWFDAKNFVKANPNYGVSVDVETFEAKVRKALETPSDVPNFRIKHLNQWISEANAFFTLEAWDKCADPSIKLSDFHGETCRVGIDLASHVDLTAYAMVFRKGDIYYIFEKTFIPEDTVEDVRSNLYEDSIAKGQLEKTKGAAINLPYIRERVLDAVSASRDVEVAYDPWGSTEMAQQLSNSVECVKFNMNVANLSEPTKKLDSLMREGKIRHNGSPLLRWQIGNVVAKEDANSNVYPRKTHERLKIDTVIAILMALALWLQHEETTSVYETRGVRTL